MSPSKTRLSLSWPRPGRERRPAAPEGGASLADLIAKLPETARAAALTHSSWVEQRIGSYERLALLGDSVLGLSVADQLFRTLPDHDAGSLTKILNQAVSGASCAAVGRELGIPEMLIAADPGGPEGTRTPARLLLEGERPLPEITEAMIGACFVEFGYRAHGGGCRRCFRVPDRDGSEHPYRLQVGATGERRQNGRDGRVRGCRCPRCGSPAHVRGGGPGSRRGNRPRRGSQQEVGRPGRSSGCPGGARCLRVLSSDRNDSLSQPCSCAQ